MNHSTQTLKIPFPALVLLIGASASGKSTFAKRHFLPTEILSSDDCRAMICDDESNQEINTQTFELLHHIARLRLANRRLTVIDATNLEFRARQPLLEMAKACQIPAIAFVFDITVETCRNRNQSRKQRVVNQEVIEYHRSLLDNVIPELDREGYASICLINEANAEKLKMEILRNAESEKIQPESSDRSKKLKSR